MKGRRFVDYARHGGCSMKLAPVRLRDLLAPLGAISNGGAGWPDAAVSQIGSQSVASSVDVVLPMIDDPALFGRIVVNHVLSDLYAVGATPVFALSILGVPQAEDEADEDAFNREIDADVQRMLVAADEALREAEVASAGGHTLMDHALFFGMAATGSFANGSAISNASAAVGDVLLLTKPIGTSVATKLWKIEPDAKDEFGDVVEAMLRSNRTASLAMRSLQRCACTDVTGFGLCGHLHNMLLASGKAAVLRSDEIPIFESVGAHRFSHADTDTRLLEPNREYLSDHLHVESSSADLSLFLDAQVSGGLLISMPASDVDHFQAEMGGHDEETWVVGEITPGEAGSITLA
jgi:selenide,water dikinase